jgi:NAD(P)-dependent dehydrogenase (short-subunit alcohol dehydrogenase family)
MDQLDGKVGVVTGAGSGIGLATSRRLAREGVRVVLADIDEGRLDEAVSDARAEGLEVTGVPTDVSSFESVKALADAAYDTYGAVHIAHFNAGIAAGASLFDDDTAQWEQAVGVNLLSVVWGIKAFVPRMIEGGQQGLVLATSSGAGAEGTSYNSNAYAVTKAGVVSVMECLYGQLRDQGSQVTAAIVFPPLTATHLAGEPENMKFIEAHLRSQGVPAALVEPDAVGAMVVDGIKRGRFFIRPGADQSKAFFDGLITDDYLAWNERIIRGRGEAQVAADGRPDGYLW